MLVAHASYRDKSDFVGHFVYISPQQPPMFSFSYTPHIAPTEVKSSSFRRSGAEQSTKEGWYSKYIVHILRIHLFLKWLRIVNIVGIRLHYLPISKR